MQKRSPSSHHWRLGSGSSAQTLNFRRAMAQRQKPRGNCFKLRARRSRDVNREGLLNSHLPSAHLEWMGEIRSPSDDLPEEGEFFAIPEVFCFPLFSELLNCAGSKKGRRSQMNKHSDWKGSEKERMMPTTTIAMDFVCLVPQPEPQSA